ncbi:hypothetical protein HNR39_003024 [Glaciimonas immobilis]|uniref:Uncharacterized protein n=1 Tax=Glaciimonas immobilis TaxID=728004 RepID=A0A840RTM4_9BURK|nr:hypothetical protein [Glaciimonas immobilis]
MSFYSGLDFYILNSIKQILKGSHISVMLVYGAIVYLRRQFIALSINEYAHLIMSGRPILSAGFDDIISCPLLSFLILSGSLVLFLLDRTL